MGDILYQLLAKILKDHPAAMPQMIANAARHADFSALDQALEPGRDVYAIAKYVALFDHDVAGIDANAKSHGPIRRGFIGLVHGLLDFDSTRNRIENADELGQYAVARGICDATAMLANEIVDYQSA